MKSQDYVLDSLTFEKIENCLCPVGVVGIGRLLSFWITKQLQVYL